MKIYRILVPVPGKTENLMSDCLVLVDGYRNDNVYGALRYKVVRFLDMVLMRYLRMLI